MSSPKVKSGQVKMEADKEKMNNPTSSFDGAKKTSPPGTPTPERCPSSASPGSPASDDTCSICLGHVTDKCVADSCLHSFCLVCLKEWSKQKAVCPLCKISFTKIMYEIKSESEYKEWVVPQPDPAEHNNGLGNFQEFLSAERRRFFGYRTTNFPGASTLRRMHGGRPHTIPDAIPSLSPVRRSARYSLRGSTMFRLSVYLNNVWVQPLADVTGRYRQTSPQLYREQPALTHRLVPWVNRELAALIQPSRIGTLLAEVMELIERHPINSREFRHAMQPHLEERTRHFVHEFYHFARSPYDMVGHDNAAQYVPRYTTDGNISDETDSDDSDAVVEVDSTGNPVASTSSGEGNRGQAAPGNVAREETLTQEGSVVISSSSSECSESESEQTRLLQPQSVEVNLEITQNPEPPLSAMRQLIGRAIDFLGNVNEGASTSRHDGSSERKSTKKLSRKPLREKGSNNEDSDGCMILEEVVPAVPTPELIELDTEDDEAHSDKQSDSTQSEVPQTAKQRKKLRGKSKPQLKRTNFPVLPDSGKEDSMNDSKFTQQDHSYCTEDGSLGMLPSTSSTHTSNNSLHDCSCPLSRVNSENRLSLTDSSIESDDGETADVKRSIASSRSTTSSNGSQSRDSIVREKHKQKNSHKRKHKSRDDSPASSSFKQRKRTVSGESRVSIKMPKKDLKCKIKSSLSRSYSRGQSDVSMQRKRAPYQNYRPGIGGMSRNSSEGSDSTWLPPSRKDDKATSIYWHRQHTDSTSSEESHTESRSSHHRESSSHHHESNSHHRESRKNRTSSKSRKSSKKRKRRSKEKHRDRVKRSSKKRKHKKSKSKKHEYWSESDSNSSEYKRHRVRPGHKRKRISDETSESESSFSYVKKKYKRETTVSVRIMDNSSTNSDTYP